MIHTAHIGIGLYGLEGSEASSSADYAFCEFKHTRRLLFYHGMNIGSKMKNYINWYMFKTTIYAMVPLYFSFFNGYSGQRTWEDIYFIGFGLFITTLPLGFYLVLDQPLPIDGKNKYIKDMIPLIYNQQRDEE